MGTENLLETAKMFTFYLYFQVFIYFWFVLAIFLLISSPFIIHTQTVNK